MWLITAPWIVSHLSVVRIPECPLPDHIPTGNDMRQLEEFPQKREDAKELASLGNNYEKVI